jgi:hypothetical protein
VCCCFQDAATRVGLSWLQSVVGHPVLLKLETQVHLYFPIFVPLCITSCMIASDGNIHSNASRTGCLSPRLVIILVSQQVHAKATTFEIPTNAGKPLPDRQ